MSTMIERVARVIFDAQYRFRGMSDFDANMRWHLSNRAREAAINLAKAAIEAMREPTEDMLQARLLERHRVQGGATDWKAMIDAALKEKAD